MPKKSNPAPSTSNDFRFKVEVIGKLRVHPDVFEQVLTDAWRRDFYPYYTKEDVIQHIAFNLLQGRSFSSLDGFANFPDRHAVFLGPTDYMDWSVHQEP